MSTAGALARDLAKAAGIGLAGGLAVAALAFVCGFAFGGAGAASGLEACKDALLVVSAIMLFILAGMLLIKGKKREMSLADNGWRDHFAVAGPKSVLGAGAVAVIVLAVVFDYAQFMLA